MSEHDRALHAKRQRLLQKQPTYIVQRRYLQIAEIWSFFNDITHGLRHLHHHGIVHRDLKPPNLLLSYEEGARQGEFPRVLISDFGECEVLDEIDQRKR